MCSACFPRSGRPTDASLPSTGSSGASSPASTVLSRRYDSLPPVPPHFVAFAWRYLRVHSFFSLPDRRVRRRGLGCYPGISRRELTKETTGSRTFLGNPNYPFAHVQSTPAGLRIPDRYGSAARPLGSQKQGLPRTVFRRSMAWLPDSLSTLRSAGYPRPTQDSLPAVGQTLLDGLSTRRVPTKGFRVLTTSHPPFPSLLGAIGSTEATSAHSASLSSDRSGLGADDRTRNGMVPD